MGIFYPSTIISQPIGFVNNNFWVLINFFYHCIFYLIYGIIKQEYFRLCLKNILCGISAAAFHKFGGAVNYSTTKWC